LLRQLLLGGQASGPLAADAHLAALAVEHGAVLHTTDQDFTRFAGLKWRNPLLDF
jgi:predicted nucleic acid-binding protein